MTEAKHTPGPWTCEVETDGLDDTYVVFAGNISVAEEIDRLANAHLIAAAPDMLAALYEAREFIDDQIDVVDGSYGQPAPNRAMSLAREIDAAIAKAGGRS